MAQDSSLSSDRFPKQAKSRTARVPAPDAFAIILLDIDHFGQYNDTYGHLAGNALLKAIAGILQATLRTTDVSARIERDVFSVLLPQTTVQGAVVVAERLLAAVAAHPWEHSVFVSIGVANRKRITLNVEQVMHEAEQALALSKKLGGNCVIHFDLTRAVHSPVQPQTDTTGPLEPACCSFPDTRKNSEAFAHRAPIVPI